VTAELGGWLVEANAGITGKHYRGCLDEEAMDPAASPKGGCAVYPHSRTDYRDLGRYSTRDSSAAKSSANTDGGMTAPWSPTGKIPTSRELASNRDVQVSIHS
jgi:hypothetical protein